MDEHGSTFCIKQVESISYVKTHLTDIIDIDDLLKDLITKFRSLSKFLEVWPKVLHVTSTLHYTILTVMLWFEDLGQFGHLFWFQGSTVAQLRPRGFLQDCPVHDSSHTVPLFARSISTITTWNMHFDLLSTSWKHDFARDSPTKWPFGMTLTRNV